MYFTASQRHEKIFFLTLLVIGVGLPKQLVAQVNLSGKAGLIYIPTAELQSDGSFTMGYNYNPSRYAIKFNRVTSESIYFVNLVLLPRFEVNVNLLRPNGTIPFLEGGVGDRNLDLKYMILTEKSKRPALALILSAPFGVDNSLLTHALVATKHMPVTQSITAGISLGYGSPYSIGRRTNANDILSDFTFNDKRKLPYRYLVGPFGGVNLSLAGKGGVMLEWDSQHLNVGAYAVLFKHWTLQAGLLNGDQLTLGTSYKLQVLRLPKRFTKKHEGS